uniref:Uncharacterized protein n=1 Tax=Escherichia coli TaxID=562 RepID=A0A3G4RUK4_ECOLX|nr:hypothetical protein D0370_00125 [Escherichia coli]
MDEWLCAVSCITSRRVYLQRTAVAGVPRYGLDGHPKGRSQTLKHRVPVADWRH